MTHPTFTRAEAAGWIRAAGRALGLDREELGYMRRLEMGPLAEAADMTAWLAESMAAFGHGHRLFAVFVRRLCRHIRD